MDSSIFEQNNASSLLCSSCVLTDFENADKWQDRSVECSCRKVASYKAARHRRLKTDTPREKKDAKYYEKRKRNNMAAKRSREAKRRRDNEMALKSFLLEKENILLKFQLSALTEELEMIKKTLVFYNNASNVIWPKNVMATFQKSEC